MKRLVLIGCVALVALAGCVRNQPSEKSPLALDRGMASQPKYKPQAHSNFFPDGATMRVPVAGTIPRGFLREDQVYFTGIISDTTPVDQSPVPTTIEVLKRGQERFNIYCSPCHGRAGDGKGIVVSRGLIPPPSFHEDRVRQFKDGHIFQVITNGIRNMPAYRYQIPPDDRWAIIAYLRALQRSQNATLQDVPADVRGTLK
jgi:mono/diheme cytochrome c family protein